MRSPLLDGPLQRQLILLKLSHENENRPAFGLQPDRNPDGDVQKWLARVGALLNRVSIEKDVSFRASMNTSRQYWPHSINLILLAVGSAIEELKLELEIYQDDQIGKVYGANDSFAFTSDVIGVVSQARKEIFVIDPYFDTDSFIVLFNNGSNFNIRILANRFAKEVAILGAKLTADCGKKIEVRKSNGIHDRLVFVDERDCWLVGASIKDAGKKPTYFVPLLPALAIEKLNIYRGLWDSSAVA